jgi:hypothetical protein
MSILDAPIPVLVKAFQNNALGPAPDDLCPAVVLWAAAAYVDIIGWTQGDYYRYENLASRLPAACVTGAIAICCYGYPHPTPSITEDDGRVAFETAMDALTVHLRHISTASGGLLVEPYGFNDHPHRGRLEVVTALIDAADRHNHDAHNDDWVLNEDPTTDDFAGTTADRKGGTAPGPTDLTDREAGGQQ